MAHTIPTSPNAVICTEIFTYIVVVFFLFKLSLDDFGQEAWRRGRLPRSSLLYLAPILLWPVTAGVFGSLLVLGLLHAGLVDAYTLSARRVEAGWRWITSFFPKRRQLEDVEMAPLGSSCRDDRSEIQSEMEAICLEIDIAHRELIEALKEECSLTRDKWPRASYFQNLPPPR